MVKKYKDYTEKDSYFQEYVNYQEKYKKNPKESDKLIYNYINNNIVKQSLKNKSIKIAEFGCSAGYLLKFLNDNLLNVKLYGFDLSKVCVDKCLSDVSLNEITFKQADLLSYESNIKFDVIILSAVTYIFNNDEFQKAIQNVSSLLNHNGHLILFDWFHSFDKQMLTINETSIGHPEGMTYHCRPIKFVKEILKNAKFKKISFNQFQIPIDLEMPNSDGELITYTVKSEIGERLMFRGALYQPWNFVYCKK